MALLPVEEARKRILAAMTPVGTETIALSAALGRVLASPVTARRTQPPADVSAMDGYAVRALDARAGAELAVIGEAPAGHPFRGRVGPGEAVRLFTGSVVPEGADAVLLQEDSETLEGGRIRVKETAIFGQHIRRRGIDFEAGEVILPPGRRLSPRDIGLAAAANHPWLTVYRRPRVALLATGDEIALPGEPIGEGGIVSSNTHALAALVAAQGAEASLLPFARDDREELARRLYEAEGFDLLVTTGGVSVGAYDLVGESLAARGFSLDFWKIAMRPGKPLLFGRLGNQPVIGLPGNPVSAFVCALLFLVPALQAKSGLSPAPWPRRQARTRTPLKENDQRFDFLRARLQEDESGTLWAEAFPIQDSSLQRVLAAADGLLLRPPFAPVLPAGSPVEVIAFADLGL